MRYAALLYIFLTSCGGGGGPAPSSGGGVGGGGGPGGPVLPYTPPPTPPASPAPVPVMLPGDSFGVLNDDARPIVAYGWWETRPGADGLYEPHWHWILPIAGAVMPGDTHRTPLTNGPVVLPQPAVGALDVAAYFADGTTTYGHVVFGPPAFAVWRVD